MNALLILMLKESLVVAIAWCAALLLRRRSSSLRHLIWAAATASFLVLPILTVALPAWRVRVLPAPKPAAALDVAPRGIPPAPAVSSPKPVQWSTGVPAGERRRDAGAALIVYGAGFLLVIARWIGGIVSVRRLIRRSDAAAEPEVRIAVDGIVPMTFGFVRPVILLPREAQSWPAEKRRSVVCHERAHIARRDWLVQQLARVAVAVQWFHPLAWLAASRMRLEAEKACDDLVLAAEHRPTAYAAHLLDIIHDSALPAPAGVSVAGSSHLEERVRSILRRDADRRRAGRGAAVAIAIATLCVLSPLAVAVPSQRETASAAVAASPLSTRVAGRSAWFAYSLSAPSLVNQMIYIDSANDSWTSATSGLSLAQRLRGDVAGDVAILVHVDASGSIDDVRALSFRLDPRIGSAPIRWIGPATADDSLDLISGALRALPPETAIAIESLHAGSARVVPHLREVLASRAASSVRAAAAEGLGYHWTEESVAVAARTAREDRDSAVGAEAAEALEQIQLASTVDELISIARSARDEAVRAEAAESLGAKREPRVVAALEAIIASDASEKVRLEAVESLGSHPSEDVQRFLRELAESDGAPRIRDEALETLRDIRSAAAR